MKPPWMDGMDDGEPRPFLFQGFGNKLGGGKGRGGRHDRVTGQPEGRSINTGFKMLKDDEPVDPDTDPEWERQKLGYSAPLIREE